MTTEQNQPNQMERIYIFGYVCVEFQGISQATKLLFQVDANN